MARRKVGYAVIGLGHIAQTAVLPAFKNARGNARLVALVSGDENKREELAAQYGARAYSYAELDACLAAEDVDALYVALPNDMHKDVTLHAAQAGVHVLCEKPMALSEEDCAAMIRACEQAGVRLMIAYRLHFEKANLEAMDLVLSGKLGEPRHFESLFCYQVKEGNIRTQAERGGGPLWDIGLYCINAARYLFRAEPEDVFGFAARGKDPRFAEVNEAVSAILRFPGERLASFTCSFGAAAVASFTVLGAEGSLYLENAYEYQGKRKRIVQQGETRTQKTYRPADQFGPELGYFSDCVLEGIEPEPSGWEGLADVRIICALHQSLRTRAPVVLPAFERRARPTREQAIEKPAVAEAEMVRTEPPFEE